MGGEKLCVCWHRGEVMHKVRNVMHAPKHTGSTKQHWQKAQAQTTGAMLCCVMLCCVMLCCACRQSVGNC